MDYVPQHGDKGNLADRDNISGARVFDGEDQGYGNRLRMQQLQQADWVAQQIKEKQLYKQQQMADNMMNHEMQCHLTNLLETEQMNHDAKRKAMV